MKKRKFAIIKTAAISVIGIACINICAYAEESGGYIVRFKENNSAAVAALMDEGEDYTPLIPELNMYFTENINNIDPADTEYIEPYAMAELAGTYDYSTYEEINGNNNTGIFSMWNSGIYGRGVRIGVIDTGCNPDPAFGNNLKQGKSFIRGVEDTLDNIGHGTAVSGIAAASYGFVKCIGTAHKAEIIPLKYYDKDENGSVIGGGTPYMISAIYSAVDEFNCNVINISSVTINSPGLKDAIDYAVSKGAIITAAVGNGGKDDKESDRLNYPAAYENVIGVGSVNFQKEHSSFSNKNESVFVTAPGEGMNILSDSVTNWGTSYSSPYVCGIIADMLEIEPELTLDETMNILKTQSEDLGTEGYDTSYGYGMVRADKILDYMLRDKDMYVSALDECDDGYNEVRVSFNEADEKKFPQCLFAGFENGRMTDASVMEMIGERTALLRAKRGDSSEYKYFVWDSIDTMKPVMKVIDK